jgi:class 3 adenylate cyclase/pimeloyl-ACP methyl ester carboxylesterase
MTGQPETYYARSGDLRIAYQVTGSGPVDLVWAPGTISHLDLSWEWPPLARVFDQLGRFCRLIRFDKRGTGLSDRPPGVATLEERTDDIRVVMDAVRSSQAAILGLSEGGQMACVFTAMHPARTRALILYGTPARWVRTDDYPWGPTVTEYTEMAERLREIWPSREYLTGWGAGLGHTVDPALLEWWLRYARAAASPSAVAALESMNGEIDIRAILPTIQVPTLVLHRTGDPVAHVEAGRDLAARIPGARFVELPGDSHWWSGIEHRILEEIEEFVTGTRSIVLTDRFLTTVCFVDIVGSTERAVALGDTMWRDLLRQYHTLVRRELARFRGEEQDMAGDGMFATFDGPARAVRCATVIRDGVRRLGIEIRAGLHTGECERLEQKVSGIAVHIGARVAGVAGAGDVLVSQTVKDLVAGSGLQFEPRGTQTLRGVPGEWPLFAVSDGLVG